MRPGYYLHDLAVAVTQAAPVDRLHHADVGMSVLCDGDTGLALHDAGHAARPEQFVVEPLIDKLLQVRKKVECRLRSDEWRCDQLQ